MNKISVVSLSIILGSVIGFFIGIASKYPIQILVLSTINGSFLVICLEWHCFGKNIAQ